MRSAGLSSLPRTVERALAKLGANIAVARKKRHLTMAMMAERVGVAYTTYQRVERGEPSVALGIYAMTLFVLDLDEGLGALADASHDEQGLALEQSRLPRRVRLARPQPSP